MFQKCLGDKIQCEKCRQIQTAISLHSDLLEMYPWHAPVRQGAQSMQLNNAEQRNKKQQANMLA